MLDTLTTLGRLGFNEAVYWLVGDTPDSHHAQAAYLWQKIGRYRRSLNHCNKYLEISNDDGIRTVQAFCLSQLGDWPSALESYESISNIWTKPSSALALAEAQLMCGKVDDARNTVATVEVSNAHPSYETRQSIEYLKQSLENVGDGTDDVYQGAALAAGRHLSRFVQWCYLWWHEPRQVPGASELKR